ncbi:MAG: beta-ketoacyl-[acyl-carrier-protein] synthase family protein [Cyclobacteriaceae bacterium]|nr:beta-ketoacyl-[acyl-carrier-protein] synthase family protein [Cyclobacteriaceae bacterium]
MTQVFVTGMGIISALGQGVGENLNRLQKGKSGIGSAKNLQSNYASLFPFGEVDASNEELAKMCASSTPLGRTDLLALIAFEEAINNASLSNEELSSYDTAIISASTVGGMTDADILYSDIQSSSGSSSYIDSYSYDAHLMNIIKKYKMKGFTATVNTACSSSANAIMLGARLIKSGRVKRAIVGGTDNIGKFTVNGFNALRILSERPCMPFDKDRSGLTLGEGSAYLVLESDEIVHNKKIYASISGYGNTNDAYHPSSISPEATGIINAMNTALNSAKITAHEIDYINAHGTGTENNDVSEMKGLTKVFDKIPPFNSTKSFTGHTLAAAGAIEAIFSILSIENGELYQSLNFKTPMDEYDVLPILEHKKEQKINHVLSNSFGFSGNCTSLVISKVI